MLSVDEAINLVLAQAPALQPRVVESGAALGLVVAQEVASEVDSPPFDKSTVDGYAVRVADLNGGTGELLVVEEVVAGAVPTRAVAEGTATRIMTGAPLPAGAESVVMVERTRLLKADGNAAERVIIGDAQLAVGQNIVRQGTAMRRGDVVLRPGHVLRSIEIGLLAEAGGISVLAVPRPRVVVLSTGDELVSPGVTPKLGQIRGSNGPMLAACAAESGFPAVDAGVVRDDRDHLRSAISAALPGADVLLLSGGVSAGSLDLVPDVMAELGVRRVFHKVSVKPGKPIWFGVLGSGTDRRLVFGLPGNPVSSYVCFQLFVRPALASLAGCPDTAWPRMTARLAVAHAQRGDRAAYRPAQVCQTPSGPIVRCIDWHGSGDLFGLAQANALACFPAGDRDWRVGDAVDVALLRSAVVLSSLAQPPI